MINQKNEIHQNTSHYIEILPWAIESREFTWTITLQCILDKRSCFGNIPHLNMWILSNSIWTQNPFQFQCHHKERCVKNQWHHVSTDWFCWDNLSETVVFIGFSGFSRVFPKKNMRVSRRFCLHEILGSLF